MTVANARREVRAVFPGGCAALLISLAVLAVVPPAAAAPKLKDRSDRVYYPVTVGDRWVTEFRYPDRTVEVTEVVTAVETQDGARVESVSRENDGRASPDVSQMKVTDNGLFRVSQLGVAYAAPYCVLRLPLTPGATWTSEARSVIGTEARLKYTAVREEEVEVPAGKFRAFRLDVELEWSGKTTHSSVWYAPRVGVIKQEHKDAGYVQVLKSFTPGKE
jgi:hypothetical protein